VGQIFEIARNSEEMMGFSWTASRNLYRLARCPDRTRDIDVQRLAGWDAGLRTHKFDVVHKDGWLRGEEGGEGGVR